MKIAVIGAGAMGCLFGAKLSKANEVIMLDSYKPQVEAIKKNGITVVDKDDQKHPFLHVKAEVSGEYKSAVDLVIVFVKSTFSEEALSANQELFGEKTIVMTLQNGAGNDRKIEKYVKKENVIIGTTKINCMNLGDGMTKQMGNGVTTIGSNYNETKIVEEVAECFTKSGLLMETSKDIQRIIWSKLFVNISINTFTALIEVPMGYMPKNKAAWNFAKRLVYEAVEVAEADGTYFDRREALEMVRKVCEANENGFSSMYQDRKKKIKTEIDAINGAVVEQAKLYGVPTPYNQLIVDMVHAVEGSYDLYK